MSMSPALFICFCNMLLMLLDYCAPTNLEIECASKFSGIWNSIRGLGESQLWKAYAKEKEPLSTKTSCLERSVPIFTSHVLGAIGQSSMYFFLMPLTQCLRSSRQNQTLYFTLLVQLYSFFTPLDVGTWVSYLLVLTLALHKVPLFGLHRPTFFG